MQESNCSESYGFHTSRRLFSVLHAIGIHFAFTAAGIVHAALFVGATAIFSDTLFHVCLAGQKVSGDWPLIRLLSTQHTVTVMQEPEGLYEQPLLNTVNVLVLDGSDRGDVLAEMVSHLKDDYPTLCVLLVDGGLTQKQVAAAFQSGASDYFPVPYDVPLLAERVRTLCLRPQSQRKE